MIGTQRIKDYLFVRLGLDVVGCAIVELQPCAFQNARIARLLAPQDQFNALARLKTQFQFVGLAGFAGAIVDADFGIFGFESLASNQCNGHAAPLLVR